jgi:hypothetical protein
MKMILSLYFYLFSSAFGILFFTEKTEGAPRYKEESITYKSDGVDLKGFVVYDENAKEKRPAVLIVPEWWGSIVI